MADESKMKLSEIATNAYCVVASVTESRASIMAQIKSVAEGGERKITIQNGSGGSLSVDIATGAGALVLDDALQELSTLEQAAAQLVAAENKAQKQVHSVTGQG